jgi:hypothetical protein
MKLRKLKKIRHSMNGWPNTKSWRVKVFKRRCYETGWNVAWKGIASELHSWAVKQHDYYA